MLSAGARHTEATTAGSCRSPVASTSKPPTSITQQQTKQHSVDMDCDDNATTVRLEQMYATLNECLLMENKFQPRLCLPANSENSEVSVGTRDGAAHVLRCLKVWFDLPADVLIDAINIFDRFLTKMKVKDCHSPCITVSCMNIALHQHGLKTAVSIHDLVSVSQSACTVGDVSRMSRIITDKLGVCETSLAASGVRWLRLMRQIIEDTARCMRITAQIIPEEIELINLLEIVMCDTSCANVRICELALVLIYHKLEQSILDMNRLAEIEGGPPVPEDAYKVFQIAQHLQDYCHMNDSSLVSACSRVRLVLSRYEARAATPTKQRLVWRLSERTLKVLRPTDRLTSLLPTIEEQHLSADNNHTSPPRNRSGSESSENEETSDWPRSPVVPVYCDN